MDDTIAYFQQQYQQLRALKDAGQLNVGQFRTEVQKLRWQDGSKVWWAFNSEGVLMRYDGRRWVAASPPPPPQTSRPTQPLQVPQPPAAQPAAVSPMPSSLSRSIPSLTAVAPGGSSAKSLAPVVAFVPGMLCGALWFLYTLLGVFKSEGIQGIDWVTPLIVGGLPLLLWVLKKPIDTLLLPVRPLIETPPKPLRLGATLAVPLFFACCCSAATPSGYLALNVSSFVSVMTAAILLRY